ncbi:gamma-secretase subunit PEN-2 [Biomphalaria glabrata]|nr:gamma-secretase subunit PEN-2-like [Biomphalaria glabrata]
MDLQKLKNEDKLILCRKYYLAGFFLLPFLWLVNAIWFFKEAFQKPHYAEQSEIRTYVTRSIIGSAIWLAAIITWVIIFQLNRVSWGATGDLLTFVIPLGEA